MRYAAREGAQPAKGEMTPMIDMTFQLIAFFMVVVNFSEVDQNERIRLPLSELAKPPEAKLQTPITLQLTYEEDANGRPLPSKVILGANVMAIPQLANALLVEKQLLEAQKEGSAKDATIIIRADRAVWTGEVQQVIEICQQTGFEKFVLRAKQERA